MLDRPHVVYFHVDNLGYGELGCYGGGILRGADTRRIDRRIFYSQRELRHWPRHLLASFRPVRNAVRLHGHDRSRDGGCQ